MTKKTNILGLEVDCLNIEQAVDEIAKLTKSNQPSMVVKPYVEFVVRAADDPEILELLNSADLCLADSVALQWASSWLQKPGCSVFSLIKSLSEIMTKPDSIKTVLPERMAGTTLVVPLLEKSAKDGLKIALVGAPKNSTIQKTAEFLKVKIPKLNIVFAQDGSNFDDKTEHELIAKINDKKPDIILLGIGFPLQEQVSARVIKKIDHGVMIGEGGSFDFVELGGKLPKAPAIMQRLGLEWLWRLTLEPSRIKRQLSIPKFIIKVFLYKRLVKHRR